MIARRKMAVLSPTETSMDRTPHTKLIRHRRVCANLSGREHAVYAPKPPETILAKRSRYPCACQAVSASVHLWQRDGALKCATSLRFVFRWQKWQERQCPSLGSFTFLDARICWHKAVKLSRVHPCSKEGSAMGVQSRQARIIMPMGSSKTAP